ncbi:MAG: hypothetical protein KAY50_09845 [Chitinophagaceae bacterium]|nr:hypothetical protein [Chitinophagaceae bacterium]
MTIISDSEFATFLTSTPLYYKQKAVENYLNSNKSYSCPDDFKDKVFKFKCPIEKEIQTFRTALPSEYRYFGTTIHTEETDREHYLPDYFDKETNTLDLTIRLYGVCQSCKTNIDFLIKMTSDKSYEECSKGINIYIQKVGQYPPYEIEPETALQKYLTDEDFANYKKALTTLSVNYGIGSYAYFRRIIENEIKRLIKDISELDFDGSDNVKQAYRNYDSDHQMSKLIDTLNLYLPNSFKELGDNPIRLLYEQLSSGIHLETDEECVEKAKQIDILLRYTIRKVNEEKYQLGEVKAAINKLRKSSS